MIKSIFNILAMSIPLTFMHSDALATDKLLIFENDDSKRLHVSEVTRSGSEYCIAGSLFIEEQDRHESILIWVDAAQRVNHYMLLSDNESVSHSSISHCLIDNSTLYLIQSIQFLKGMSHLYLIKMTTSGEILLKNKPFIFPEKMTSIMVTSTWASKFYKTDTSLIIEGVTEASMPISNELFPSTFEWRSDFDFNEESENKNEIDLDTRTRLFNDRNDAIKANNNQYISTIGQQVFLLLDK